MTSSPRGLKRRKRRVSRTPQKIQVTEKPNVIPPTRREAEADIEQFFLLINLLRNRKPTRRQVLTLEQMADVLGCDEGTVSRKLDQKRFTDSERKLLLDDIYDRNLLYGSYLDELHSIPHSLFYAMIGYFHIQQNELDRTRALAAGTYKYYRYSTRDPEKYICARIDLTPSSDGAVLNAVMSQPKKAIDGAHGGPEVLHGYFFPVGANYFMMLREYPNNNVRCVFFKTAKVAPIDGPNSIYAQNTDHIIEMDGLAIGMDLNQMFFSVAHMQLVDDKSALESINDELDVVSDVGQDIKDRLKRFQRIVW